MKSVKVVLVTKSQVKYNKSEKVALRLNKITFHLMFLLNRSYTCYASYITSPIPQHTPPFLDDERDPLNQLTSDARR